MGNRGVKYVEHSEGSTDVPPLGNIDNTLSCTGDIGLPESKVNSTKDPRSPTVEFTRTLFYSKLTTHNDRSYSQLSTVADDGHNVSESFHDHPLEGSAVHKSYDHLQLPPSQIRGSDTNVGDGSQPSLIIQWNVSSDVDSTKPQTDNKSEVTVPAVTGSNDCDVDWTEQLPKTEDSTPSNARRKPFPRIAFGAPKYSPIHSGDD